MSLLRAFFTAKMGGAMKTVLKVLTGKVDLVKILLIQLVHANTKYSINRIF